MKERIGALDRIMKEVSHDIKLPKMAKTANGFDEELQKGIKVEMEDHGMNEVEAEKTAREELAKDPEHYSKEEAEEGMEDPAEEKGETPAEEDMEEASEGDDEEKPHTAIHLSISDLGRGKMAQKPRGNPNFKKRY